jgi:hypothetical protein
MKDVITKARGTDNLNRPVMVPLYPANLFSVEWDEINNLEPVNTQKNLNAKTGIRSKIDLGDALTDIQGRKVGMLTMVNNEVYRDVVTLVGTTNTNLIVTFDDEPGVNYSVRRSIARLVNDIDGGQ